MKILSLNCPICGTEDSAYYGKSGALECRNLKCDASLDALALAACLDWSSGNRYTEDEGDNIDPVDDQDDFLGIGPIDV